MSKADFMLYARKRLLNKKYKDRIEENRAARDAISFFAESCIKAKKRNNYRKKSGGPNLC